VSAEKITLVETWALFSAVEQLREHLFYILLFVLVGFCNIVRTHATEAKILYKICVGRTSPTMKRDFLSARDFCRSLWCFENTAAL